MNSGHWSRSFSSVAASVEKPVLVFFAGARPRSVYRISRSWIGELRLNGRPTTSCSTPLSRLTSAVRRSLSCCSAPRSTAMPTCSIFASTRTSGFSMVAYRSAMPCLSSAACERVGEVRRSPAPRERPAWLSSMPVSPKSSWPLALRLVGRELERRVLLEQVADRVARLGRVDEVGGDRRVERRAAQVVVARQQPAHQRLDVVAAHVGVLARAPWRRGSASSTVGRDPHALGRLRRR